MKLKRISMFFILCILLIGSPVAASQIEFSDVSKNDSHYENIIRLVERGITKGYPDGTFLPNSEISRQHVAVMLNQALQLDAPKDLNGVLAKYKDVGVTHTYAKEIAAVTEAGVFSGGAGLFNPDRPMTRGQMATVLVKAFGIKDNGQSVDLSDLNQIDRSHRTNVKILTQSKIVSGKTNSAGQRYYDANSSITRAQFATMLNRALVYNENLGQTEVKQEKKTETIPFKTVLEKDPTLEVGKTRPKQAGKNGKREITYEVTYRNGLEMSRKVIRDAVVEQPVDKITLIGTKESNSGVDEGYPQEVLNEVNKERKKAGVSPLRLEKKLNEAALSHSRWMRDTGRFEHSQLDDLLDSIGLNYRTGAENIALGYGSSQEVVDAWMKSEGHRKNILNPRHSQMGIGYKDGFWTQLFIGN